MNNHDPFGAGEDEHDALHQRQFTSQDAKASLNQGNKSPNEHLSPSRPLSNTINRKESTLAGQCPFSGQGLAL